MKSIERWYGTPAHDTNPGFCAPHHPDLQLLRPPAIEGRFDVLAGLPQLLARPRERTQGCLCADPDFQAHAAVIHARPAEPGMAGDPGLLAQAPATLNS